MKISPHFRLPLFLVAVLAFSLTFFGCSSDEPVGPSTTTTPTTFSETETYQAIAQIDGGRELLAQIPEADKRQWREGSRLYLAYESNTIEPGQEDVDPPLNSSYFRYEGFGIPLGHHTGEGPSIENFATLTQVGSVTLTDWRGDQLSCDDEGTFTLDETTGEVEFGGDIVSTGGTGRYEGVTGSGGYVGRANVFEAVGQSVWYGSLNLGD